ncbi:MAG: hypothetical protein AAFZ01_03130 [Pseudomonadota bacterium]
MIEDDLHRITGRYGLRYQILWLMDDALPGDCRGHKRVAVVSTKGAGDLDTFVDFSPNGQLRVGISGVLHCGAGA